MTRHKSIVLATAALLTGISCAEERPPTEPSGTPQSIALTHLNAVIDTMQKNSVNRQKVDWASLRRDAIDSVKTALSIWETYPGIRLALTRIADGHSSYIGVDGTVVYVPTRSCVGSRAPVPTNLPQDVGYVKVGGFSGTPEQALAFATDIQNTIRSADRANMTGWIIDLRGNTGGNMWPMVAGLGPVVGEGVLGWFVDPAGAAEQWSYQNGASILGATAVTRVASPYALRISRPKVAVLVDNAVASSGEATFIAFRTRPNTRSFGLATCGLSTSNVGFKMPDGARLVLSVATMADRTKSLYGDRVVPDEIITDPTAVVDRAIAWLQSANP